MNFQITLPQLKLAKIGWRASLGWLGAFISFPLAGLAAQAVVGAVDNPVDGLIGGAVAGTVIGLGQWLVLRQTHQIKPRWIIATSLGMALGLGLALAVVGNGISFNEIALRALLTGGVIGLAQSLVLQRGLGVASLWALSVTASFTLAWIITSRVIVNALSNGYANFGASGAIVFQIITGLVLLLFVAPKPAGAQFNSLTE